MCHMVGLGRRVVIDAYSRSIVGWQVSNTYQPTWPLTPSHKPQRK